MLLSWLILPSWCTLLDLLCAWSCPYRVMLFDLAFVVPSCLMVSISCCAAGPSLPHVNLLCVLYIMYIMLSYSILISRCYIVRPSLPHARLLHHPPYLMLLGVLYTRIPELCFLVIWFCIHEAKLFDLLYLLLHSRLSLPHVMLLEVLYITLGFLRFS